MFKKNLPKDIARKIRKLFPDPEQLALAEQLLSEIFIKKWNVGSGQLVRSLVVLSKGNIEELKAKLSFQDPRDIIMEAERASNNPGHFFQEPFSEYDESEINDLSKRQLAAKVASDLYQGRFDYDTFVTEYPGETDDDDIERLFSFIEHEPKAGGLFGVKKNTLEDYRRDIQQLIRKLGQE